MPAGADREMTTNEPSSEAAATLPTDGAAGRIAGAVDRVAAGLARHWLAVFNTIVAVFVFVPFLAPVLMHLGSTTTCAPCTAAGRLIYLVYSPFCHQLPERSYFLFGPQKTYGLNELEARGVLPAGLNILQRQFLRYQGAPDLGYKVALCERDTAIFGSLLLGGLLFGLARSILHRRGREVPRLPVWAYLLALAPIAIDGVTQLIGLRESNWVLRTLTGAIFGLATVWLAYPYVQEAMADVLRTSQEGKASGARRDVRTGQNPPRML
jgi:uncharacterized membrane protein